MNLLDIISLAKAGYKKSDIDELLKIKIDESEENDDGSNSKEEENTSKGDDVDFPEDSDDKKPDYEKMYKDLETEFEKVKNDLKTIQESNRKKDNSDKDVDPMKDLEDVFRSFM